MKKNFWVWIIPSASLVFILNIAGHFLYMVVYSYIINPGQEFTSYERHAVASAPYASFVVGFPAMLLVCRWISKRTPASLALIAALLVSLVYMLIDLSIVLYLQEYSSIILLFAISYAPYFIAAYVGAAVANRSEMRSDVSPS